MRPNRNASAKRKAVIDELVREEPEPAAEVDRIKSHSTGVARFSLRNEAVVESEEEVDPKNELASLAAFSNENRDSDTTSQDIVDVDFEFFDPKPEDYHGVKALLRSYLDDTTWDLGGFVDIILSQTRVGTVIKTAEDESPIGVITALNIGRYKDHACMKNICQFLLGKCNDKSVAAELEAAIFEKHPDDVGLLVSERLINMPVELAPPLHKGLFDEIFWATEDEPSQALRDAFKFKYYLLVTRIFQQLPKKKKASKIVKKMKMKKGLDADTGDASKSGSLGGLIYIKPEDELFHQLSTWSYTFPVNAESLAAHEVKGLRQLRLVMFVNSQQIATFRSQFCTLGE